jgi:hypothetical protein
VVETGGLEIGSDSVRFGIFRGGSSGYGSIGCVWKQQDLICAPSVFPVRFPGEPASQEPFPIVRHSFTAEVRLTAGLDRSEGREC